MKTIESESQFVPCKAGVLSAVIYANGDVSVCETHQPLGNLREKRFFEIWDSPAAKTLRAQIKAKECFCTNKVFMSATSSSNRSNSRERSWERAFALASRQRTRRCRFPRRASPERPVPADIP